MKLPPRIGPWLEKLHIGDNGIDPYGVAAKFAPVLTMRLLSKWIVNSDSLKELSMENNLIGDLGGREILDALNNRKAAGINALYLRVTHRLNPDTFKELIKIGSGVGQKKKKKKKGKGKPGGRRI